ncbi:MAG: hypothetical protein ACJAUP_003548 [Cellvibrionaceae bacterium]|jgi:hypothetical protein
MGNYNIMGFCKKMGFCNEAGPRYNINPNNAFIAPPPPGSALWASVTAGRDLPQGAVYKALLSDSTSEQTAKTVSQAVKQARRPTQVDIPLVQASVSPQSGDTQRSYIPSTNFINRPIPLDGDCLFRAILTGLSQPGENVSSEPVVELRARVSTYLETNQHALGAHHAFEGARGLNNLWGLLLTTGQWNEDAGDLVPQLLAQVLGRDIHILEPVDEGRAYTERAVLHAENLNLPPGSQKTGKPIYLAHVNNRSHYEHLEPRNLPETTTFADTLKRQKESLEQDKKPQPKLQQALPSEPTQNPIIPGSQPLGVSATNTSSLIPSPKYRIPNNSDQNLRRYSFPEAVTTIKNVSAPKALGYLIPPLASGSGIFGQVSPGGTLTYHVDTNKEGNHLSGQELIQSLIDKIGQTSIARIQTFLVKAPGIDSDYRSYNHYRHNENMSPVEAAANTHAGRFALRSGYRDVCVIHDEISKGILIEFAWPGMAEYSDDTNLGKIQTQSSQPSLNFPNTPHLDLGLGEKGSDDSDDSYGGLFF